MIQTILYCNRCGNKVATTEFGAHGTMSYVNAGPNSLNHFDFDLCPACRLKYTSEFTHKRSDEE